ncbi:MAG: LysM peptidoglycan-binding domain-containing protein, partial [Candidatus Puniceispirillaceae bacterium]
MRLVMGLLLLGGGGLAALALAWMFYSTSDPSGNNNQTDVSVIAPETPATPEERETPKQDVATLQAGKAEQAEVADAASPPAGTVLPLIINIARIGPDGSAVIAGTAPPETEIRVLDGTAPLVTTQSNGKGEWVAVPDDLLGAGNHLIVAEMTGPDGQIIRTERGVLVELADSGAEKPLVALVPMSDDAAVEILSAPDQLASADIAEKPADSQESAEQVQAQKEVTAILVMPPEIYIGTLSWSAKNILQIKGKSNGGAAVTGSFAGQSFADVSLDEQGNWSTKISVPATQSGMALIQANLLDVDNSLILSTQVDVDLAQLNVGLDGSEMVIIRKGDMLWRIAYRTYGSGIRYLDILKRNARQINNPDLIYPAQVFALPDAG